MGLLSLKNQRYLVVLDQRRMSLILTVDDLLGE